MTIVDVYFQDGDYAGEANVQDLGSDHYRLADEPAFFWFASDDQVVENIPKYDDIFRAILREDGALQLVEIVQRSRLKSFHFVAPKSVAESANFEETLKRLSSAGGYWETYMGGILLAYSPEGAEFDLGAEIEALIRAA